VAAAEIELDNPKCPAQSQNIIQNQRTPPATNPGCGGTMNAIKLLKPVLALAAGLFLCGCPSVHPQYLARPEPFVVEGTYVHPGSQIQMPKTVDGFKRDKFARYDVDGLDVSAGYNCLTAYHRIVATVYVYPTPPLRSIGSPPDVIAEARAQMTDREFERRKHELQYVHPGATLMEQHDIVHREGGQSYPGKTAIYEYDESFGGVKQPLRSQVCAFCYVGEKWAVEYRFTFPKADHADEEIQEFMDQWNWYALP
jgi:ribosomal protein L35AE/L33A